MSNKLADNTILGYQFNNPELLKEALTHPSLRNKQPNYERMEFLGDTIVNFVLAEMLYNKFPQSTEGELSVLHSVLVRKNTLAQIAIEHDFGGRIKMDSGEEKIGGRQNINNLENVLEAIIAAIFLDSSYDQVRSIILNVWDKHINNINIENVNPKSQLQEVLQAQGKGVPTYVVKAQDGLAHKPIFTVSVTVEGYPEFEAQGNTKKEAEIMVATKFLEYINQSK